MQCCANEERSEILRGRSIYSVEKNKEISD